VTKAKKLLNVFNNPKNWFNSLKSMVALLMALVLFVFALWLLCKCGALVISFFHPDNQIVIMPFETADSSKSPAQALLASRFRSMAKRSVEPPAGYGIFSLPMLDSSVTDSTKITNALKDFDNVTFKIKDVDFVGLIKSFDSVLSPYSYEVKGSVTQNTISTLVTAQLTFKNKVLGVWESEISGTQTGDQALRQACDDLAYEITYDLMTKPELSKFGIKSAGDFNNWQSLKSYVEGLSAFKTYQTTHDTNQLAAAYTNFNTLVCFQPESRLGLYFRGLVQSERRKELESVADFQKLQRVIKKEVADKSGANLSKEDRVSRMKVCYEAQLNEATSLLKTYEEGDGPKAILILKSLVAEINEKIVNDKKATDIKQKQASTLTPDERKFSTDENALSEDERSFYSKLLILANAQLAYSHGTFISYLKDTGLQEITDEVNSHKEAFDRAIKAAEEGKQILSTNQITAEMQELEFRICNAKGYGVYRYAFFDAFKGKDTTESDEIYRRDCVTASEILERAQDLRPDHYEVLQNLGMIFNDERFDPAGNYLMRAKELFESTMRFVPDDYYQYEQLAETHLRLATLQNDDRDKCVAEITQGLANIELAMAKRAPVFSQSAFVERSKLLFLAWTVSTNRDGVEADAALRGFISAVRKTQNCVKHDEFNKQYSKLLGAIFESRGDTATKLIPIVTDLNDYYTVLQKLNPKAVDTSIVQTLKNKLAAIEARIPSPPPKDDPSSVAAVNLKKSIETLDSIVK
jgi:hypothetical protein